MQSSIVFVGQACLASMALPLTVLAMITSFLSFSILLVRMCLVYVELGAALFHHWAFVDSQRAHKQELQVVKLDPPPPKVEGVELEKRRRSIGSITPIRKPSLRKRDTRKQSFAHFTGEGPHRDFEGLGGWALTSTPEEPEAPPPEVVKRRIELPIATLDRQKSYRKSMSLGPRGLQTPGLYSFSALRTPGLEEKGAGADSYFRMTRPSTIAREDSSVRFRLDRSNTSKVPSAHHLRPVAPLS